MTEDISSAERLVVKWAAHLHTAVWLALVEAVDYQRAPRPQHDLPEEFRPVEWLLDGDRWPVVKKAIAVERRVVQIKKYRQRKRARDTAFRERRRVYMRAYRAKIKQKQAGKWLDD